MKLYQVYNALIPTMEKLEKDGFDIWEQNLPETGYGFKAIVREKKIFINVLIDCEDFDKEIYKFRINKYPYKGNVLTSVGVECLGREETNNIDEVYSLVKKLDNRSLSKDKIIVAPFEPTKMHLYDVKTQGKHPVHIIDGGEYITEDERVLDSQSDCGWFFLNQKEYDYFKSQCREIDVKEVMPGN